MQDDGEDASALRDQEPLRGEVLDHDAENTCSMALLALNVVFFRHVDFVRRLRAQGWNATWRAIFDTP